MNDTSHTFTHPKPEFFDKHSTGALPLGLLAASAIGIIGCLIGLLVPSQRPIFAFSWLFAFAYFLTLCVGCLFWTFVHHATDAEWSVVVRRVLETVASLVPLLVIFFIPVLICAPILFKWWTGVGFWSVLPGADHLLHKKFPYLTHGFFWFRSVLYFTVFVTAALSMRRFSTRQDKDGHPKHTLEMRRVAFAGIPFFALSLTFGAFDWLMGLDYHWFSTMWGVYIFAGAAGSSMSLLVLIVTWLRSRGYMGYVTTEHYHIMGKLMLAFVVFWAYIGFSQYMLIWYANMPEETSYFIRRNVGSWNTMSLFLVIGRFFLPFPFLLMQGIKKNPKHLCMVAGWIVFMQMIDLYIIVMPMRDKFGISPSIYDLLSLLAIGPLLIFFFLKKIAEHSLFPARDPRLALSLKLTN